jgi:hypothetical protein
MTTQHFLAAEPRLLSLMQTVPGLAHVAGWADTETALAGQVNYPAALVVYDGDTGADARGNAALTTQRWVVVLVDYAPQTQGSQDAARASLGPLISATIDALNGQRLDERWMPLKFAGGVVPRYLKGGLAAMAVPFHLTRPL